MAAPPVLLVADDLSVIAAVKRVLAREGYECVLATSAADAVIAWGHMLPGLILLQPSVESDRGGVVLEELRGHPDAKLLRIVLLGETVPGFTWPVVPLPLDPEDFASLIDENIRTTDGGGAWSVRETAPASAALPVVETPSEPDAWRATSPQPVDRQAEGGEEMPDAHAIVPEPTPPEPGERAPGPAPDALEEKLFGDLAAGVEAEAMQSVDSMLQLPDEDEELRLLEEDVRAEARKRRQAREARAITVKPAAAPVNAKDEVAEAQTPGEDSFEDLAEAGAPPPSRAAEVLARAEQMVLESRAQGEAHQRAEEADARHLREETATAVRRAEYAEEQVRSEREARGASEEALHSVRDELQKLSGSLATERELSRVRHESDLEGLRADAEAAREALADPLRERVSSLETQLEGEAERGADAQRAVEAAKKNLAAREAELQASADQLSATCAEVEEAKAQLEAANFQVTGLEAKVAELEVVALVATEEQTKRHALEEVVTARDAQVEELTLSLLTAREDADAALALASEVEAERQRLEEARSQLQLAEQDLAETRTARDDAQTEMLALEAARDELQVQLSEAQVRLQALQADVTSASALLEDTARERDSLRTRIATLEPFQPLAERLGAELEAESRHRAGIEARLEDARGSLEAEARQRAALEARLEDARGSLEAETRQRAAIEARLEDARGSLESTRTLAESLEATAQLASEKVKALEAREVMSLALPGKHAVGVARHGAVDLEGLARVVSQLVLGNAEVRLELGTTGGTRTLWFKRGQIVAAESTLEHEGLIARARRDGLIDTRQDAELRMLRGATPREQLDALKGRGFIRDIESVPLVQRYTEQVALDAFTEEQTQYRVAEEVPRPDVLLATVPRPTLPMLAESLRRAVAPDVMLERLGGGEAVPVATDSELDLRALGFSERERKMLTWVDAEATVEDLSLASGLKPDLAFRALLVAQLLGIIVVRPGVKKSEPSSGQLDLHRLEAKFDEVQDADYFTILGLSRAAGTEDVRRAYQRLAQEFDPLRFSGHPDAGIQQRAQVVAKLLEEAARALEDDRRRLEYARHLLD